MEQNLSIFIKYMTKYLLGAFAVAMVFVACKKQGPENPPLQNVSGLRGRYVMYMKIDTFYDYSSATVYTLNVTHETLTGDTLYIKAGTASQVIQSNPIAGYDPKIALADTLIFVNGDSGTRNVPRGAIDFKYNVSLKSYVESPIPGVATHLIVIGPNEVEVTTDITDPDGGMSSSNGSYYKKL